MAANCFADCARMLRRHRQQQNIAAGEIGQIVGSLDRGIERNAGQEKAIFVFVVDRGDDFGLAHPHQRLASGALHAKRQRRSPRAAADNADILERLRHVDIFERLLASGSRGQRGRAAVSSPSL